MMQQIGTQFGYGGCLSLYCAYIFGKTEALLGLSDPETNSILESPASLQQTFLQN